MTNTFSYRACQEEARANLRDLYDNPDKELYFVQTGGSRVFCPKTAEYKWEVEPTNYNIKQITPFAASHYSFYAMAQSIWNPSEHQVLSFNKSKDYFSEYYIGGRVMTKEAIEEEYGIDMSSGSYGLGPACGDMLRMGILNMVDYTVPPNSVNVLLREYCPEIKDSGLKQHLLTFVFQVTTTDEDGYVTYFRNYKDYKRERRTKQKVGRALRYMFPDLTILEVEKIVRVFNEKYSNVEYRVVESTEAQEFNFAYSGDTAPDRNPYMYGCWKPLSASCMHYDSSEFGFAGHPAESYASGDFSIVYTVTPDNKIGSRSVVYLKNKAYGPIYTMDAQAGTLLEEYLKEQGYTYNKYWAGARIQPQDGFSVGGVLRVPYLDGDGNFVCCDDGNMYIDHGPSGTSVVETYAGQETAGYIYPAVVCVSCDRVIYDGDGYEVYNHPEYAQTCGCCGQYAWTEDTQNVIHYTDAVYFEGDYYEEAVVDTCTYSGTDFLREHEDCIELLDGDVLLRVNLSLYTEDYGCDNVPEDERPVGWDDNEDDTEERVA